jgi:hypothetical protein
MITIDTARRTLIAHSAAFFEGIIAGRQALPAVAG